MKTYDFEMSLLVFLRDWVVAVVSILVLSTGSNTIARKRIVYHGFVHMEAGPVWICSRLGPIHTGPVWTQLTWILPKFVRM